MKCVEELVKEVYDSCKIPFQLTIEEVGEFSTPLFELVQNQSEKVLIIITLSAVSR